jgi:NADH-quinone oxidoreductase subunit N
MGYLLVALLAIERVGEAGNIGIEAAVFYLVVYVLMTQAAFVVIGERAGSGPTETSSIDAYQGLFWTQPVQAGVFTIALLSLAGIPLTAGFIGKFYLFAAGIEGVLWFLVWSLIVGSALGIYYYLRIVLAMASSPGEQDVERASTLATTVAVALSAMVLVLGVFPAPLIRAVQWLINY